jgi:hypothetical protein
MASDEKRAEGPCTFLIQRPDKTWTYCGQPGQSIWMHAAAGRYFRCAGHRPSQLDVHASGQRQH